MHGVLVPVSVFDYQSDQANIYSNLLVLVYNREYIPDPQTRSSFFKLNIMCVLLTIHLSDYRRIQLSADILRPRT